MYEVFLSFETHFLSHGLIFPPKALRNLADTVKRNFPIYVGTYVHL